MKRYRIGYASRLNNGADDKRKLWPTSGLTNYKMPRRDGQNHGSSHLWMDYVAARCYQVFDRGLPAE